MKCLFLSASRYSLSYSIVKGFKRNGWDIKVIDYYDFYKYIVNRFITKTIGLPDKIKSYWFKPYLKNINKQYYDIFNNYKPDLVFIYNNQYVSPDIIHEFQKKAKIAFILGDNPFYTKTSPYNAHILFAADYIICPDTFWIDQLSRIGIGNLYFDCFSFDSDTYCPVQPSKEQLQKYKSDVIYVGLAHLGSQGYKRFLFLNYFKTFNVKIYMNGNGYKKHWHSFFPELKDKIIEHNSYDSKFNNLVYNCSKIAPVDLTTALFNGVHIRIFDALGSGILPLSEYSKDLEIVFDGINYPSIKNYSEIPEITSYFLNNENDRQLLIKQMRKRVLQNYLPEKVIGRLTSRIF